MEVNADVSKSIAKPGEWFGQPEYGWTTGLRRFANALGVATFATLPISALLGRSDGASMLGYFVCTMWLGVLLQVPQPLKKELAQHKDENEVVINLRRSGHLGSDSGLLWFEEGRMFFTGQACSFAISRNDITWNIIDGKQYRSNDGIILDLNNGCQIHISAANLNRLERQLRAFRYSVDTCPDDRQLPPMQRRGIPKPTLKWTDLRMWIPCLPTLPQNMPLGGLLLVGCVWATFGVFALLAAIASKDQSNVMSIILPPITLGPQWIIRKAYYKLPL